MKQCLLQQARSQWQAKFIANNLRKQAEKENELVAELFKIPVIEKTPAEAIAKESINRSKTIEDAHKSLYNFLREIELTNQIVSNFTEYKSRNAYRSLDKYWLYPIPTFYKMKK